MTRSAPRKTVGGGGTLRLDSLCGRDGLVPVGDQGAVLCPAQGPGA